MNIGIDTVEIPRIEKLLEKESFLRRFFSEAEINELQLKNNKPCHVAAAFSAKEAFSKAIGTGIVGFALNEVSLLHKENGKPYLSFSGNAEKIVKEGKYSFDVSITHTESLATAVVIAFKTVASEGVE